MNCFDYVKPELIEYRSLMAQGEGVSCYVDCTADDICSTSDDEI